MATDRICRAPAMSDKISYKILFILNYGLEDMNYAKSKHLQEFQKTENWEG
jgi:hypothetical protein